MLNWCSGATDVGVEKDILPSSLKPTEVDIDQEEALAVLDRVGPTEPSDIEGVVVRFPEELFFRAEDPIPKEERYAVTPEEKKKDEEEAGEDEEVEEDEKPVVTTKLHDIAESLEEKPIPDANQTNLFWTISLVLVCICFVFGVLFNHIAAASLIHALKDIPSNVAKGFDEGFRFAYLERDATDVQSHAALALSKCSLSSPDALCVAGQQPLVSPLKTLRSLSTNDEKMKIVAEFRASLGIVAQITSDPYFGTVGFANTNKYLIGILDQLDKITGELPCVSVVEIYCAIHSMAGFLVAGMGEVQDAKAEITTAQIVTTWDEHEALLYIFHLWPYLVVIGVALFGCVLCKSVLVWTFAFVLFAAVVILGFILSYEAKQIKVSSLKGNPTISQLADHVQDKYPEFWNIALKDAMSGLDKLWLANVFLLAFTLFLGIHSAFLCACRSHRKYACVTCFGERPISAAR